MILQQTTDKYIDAANFRDIWSEMFERRGFLRVGCRDMLIESNQNMRYTHHSVNSITISSSTYRLGTFPFYLFDQKVRDIFHRFGAFPQATRARIEHVVVIFSIIRVCVLKNLKMNK